MIVFLCCLGIQHCLFSLDVGDSLSVQKLTAYGSCIHAYPPSANAEKAEQELIYFLDANSSNRINDYFRMISEFQDNFQDFPRGVTFAVILLNGTADMLPPDLEFPVYLDPEKKIWQNYVKGEIIMPFAAVIANGKLQWKGSPTEVPTVIQRLQNGTFSRTSQDRISMANRDLQRAVQAGLPDVIMSAADRILAIQPGELTAVQAKLFVYNNSGKQKEALDFLSKQIVLCTEMTQLKFFALNAAVAADDKEAWQKILWASCNDLNTKYRSAARVFCFAVNNAPFGWLPYPGIMQLTEKILQKMPPNLSAAFQASVWEHAARAAYLGADVVQAEKYQKKACELRKNTRYEKSASDLLQYYQSILESTRKKL